LRDPRHDARAANPTLAARDSVISLLDRWLLQDTLHCALGNPELPGHLHRLFPAARNFWIRYLSIIRTIAPPPQVWTSPYRSAANL
jgi:hypothetical protein